MERSESMKFKDRATKVFFGQRTKVRSLPPICTHIVPIIDFIFCQTQASIDLVNIVPCFSNITVIVMNANAKVILTNNCNQL